jgi:spore coat polysaccharide biosynthesis protein SpsF
MERVVERARSVPSVDLVLLATSDQPSDDVLADHCTSLNIPCFRGSQDDVLDRYYKAARHMEAEAVVRLTADCPLLDPTVIEKVIHTFQSGAFDYVSNALDPTYPDGLDTEVFSFTALHRAWRGAKLQSEREHVTPYIWKHPTHFRLGSVKHNEDLSRLRWTVDEPEDLEFARCVYGYLGADRFRMADVLAILEEHPEVMRINTRFDRNEGYQKSLREDETVTGERLR